MGIWIALGTLGVTIAMLIIRLWESETVAVLRTRLRTSRSLRQGAAAHRAYVDSIRFSPALSEMDRWGFNEVIDCQNSGGEPADGTKRLWFHVGELLSDLLLPSPLQYGRLTIHLGLTGSASESVMLIERGPECVGSYFELDLANRTWAPPWTFTEREKPHRVSDLH